MERREVVREWKDTHNFLSISKVMLSFVSGKCIVMLVTKTTDG